MPGRAEQGRMVCPFSAIVGQEQIIDLPFNATEDMVLGGLDFEEVLQNGTRRF
ncbi:MAG: hypothetical protein KQI62_00725 [Deltaproteobacteria bacterium]|nr:hypothetical protein [Deltaproteobacteria bacterium]